MESPSTTNVLIVDDDEVLAGMLVEYLGAEGCNCTHVVSGELALRKLSRESFDIILLDIMMPGMGGIETLKAIRNTCSLPVVMLTARGDDLDRILGLELGADDYLPKPCNPRELLARIRAVVRRSQASEAIPENPIYVGDLELNPSTRGVIVDGEGIDLTQTEFDLLYLLASRPEQILSKQEISSRVLGKPLSQWDRSIDVHVSNLRKKLGQHPGDIPRIKTLRGSGYLYSLAGQSS